MQEVEIWKDIKDYEGLYQVSNLGRVKSVERVVFRIKKGDKPCRERILKHNEATGYRLVRLSKCNIAKQFKIHRLVAVNFIENINNKPCVNHKDGVKTNNFVDNLEWCTIKENTQHSYDMGLQKKQHGSQRYCAKLNEEKVLEIKKLLNNGVSCTDIAKKYSVDRMTINDILKNKTWVRVTL